MAADFFVDDIAIIERSIDLVTIGGVDVGGSESFYDDRVDDSMWGLPPEYFKQFSSATPSALARAAYNPATDLPIETPRGYRDAYLGAPIRSLMTKANRANHVVSANGESIPVGGGGKNNGGGVAKKIAAIGSTTSKLDESEDPELPDTRFEIHGFTRGLAEFYYDDQSLAREILQQLVVYVKAHKSLPDQYASAAYALPPKPLRRRFEVRGLQSPEDAAYSQALGGYVITPTGSSTPSTVNVTVQCTIAGTIGNAQPAQINLILAGPIVPIGIGSVSNAIAFNTAIDVETDAKLKTRFQAKFAGVTDEGSPLSILATVLGVQPGLTASVVDLNNAGTAQDAWFTVYVNTLGATSTTTEQLIQEVQIAVDAIRSAGISRQVLPSTIEVVNFTGHLTLATGADTVAVPQAAAAAVAAYINGIGLDPMGNPTIVSPAQVVRAILQSSSDILDVTSISINGGFAELTAAVGVQFSAGSIVFS